MRSDRNRTEEDHRHYLRIAHRCTSYPYAYGADQITLSPLPRSTNDAAEVLRCPPARVVSRSVLPNSAENPCLSFTMTEGWSRIRFRLTRTNPSSSSR